MEEDNVNDIIEYLLKTPNLEESEIVNAIRAIGDTNDKSAVPYLMDMLVDLNNSGYVLQTVAISLGKLKADEAVPHIIDYVRKNEFNDIRGGFLYALLNLNCKNYFIDFIDLFCNGSFNVSEISYLLIEKYYLEEEKEELVKAYEKLELKKVELNKNKVNDNLAFISKVQKMIKVSIER